MSFDPTSIRLPGNSRQLIRDAVRQSPRQSVSLGGRKINDLNKDDLLIVANEMNIDIHSLIREGQAAGTAPHAPARDAAPADAPLLDLGDAGTVDLESEATRVRRALSSAMVEGDFAHVNETIKELLARANKPAVTNTVVEYVTSEGTPAAPPADAPRAAVPAIGSETWARLFGIAGSMKARREDIFAPGALTPKVDERYRWPMGVTEAALCALGHGMHIWLYGPAGTGKSSFGEQFAARTGRPFFLIACDDTTEAPELLGMTVPFQGGTRWQDGVLTAAIRTPNAVILIDEPTVARPGALMVLQSVLASGVLSIKETGIPVRVAPGVKFIVADNTNGTGGGTAEGYEGTRRLNRATLDRFASFLKIDYMAPSNEAAALVAHTGCTPELAAVLVECAGLTRKARVTHALGLRRLIAWAHALTDGLPPRVAFETAILNGCAKDDREPTEQCCALGLDKSRVTLALQGRTVAPAPDLSAPAAPLSRAAADFAG